MQIFTSLVATFTLNVILSAMQGHPGDLSNPGLVSFGTFEVCSFIELCNNLIILSVG